jgi:hypothetical protein
MANKKKITHNTTPVKRAVRIVDVYRDIITGLEKPVSDAHIERLASDWIAWSNKEDSLRVTDFFLEMNIHNGIVYRWLEKFPVLKEAHTLVMQRLASRREKGALTRKYDPNTIERYQPLYDKDYRDIVEWRASLRDKSEDSGGGTIIVNLPPAPMTKEVPERKKE